MTRVLVDPAGLGEVAGEVTGVGRRLGQLGAEIEAVTGQLLGWAAGPSGGNPLAGELAGLGPRAVDVVARVMALARLIAVVAESFAGTEARVAGSLAGAAGSVALPPIWSVLEGLDPAGLELLLVGCPALARLVVDRPAGARPGSAAAQLATILASGEPPIVLLAAGQGVVRRLTPAARRTLSLLHPALVAGLASAPAADRFLATRVLIAAALVDATGPRRHRYEELLHGTVTLTRPDGARVMRPHQVLAFDPRGDGQIVEVFGDLATARHLAVYVPGTGTGLDRYAGNAVRASHFAAAEPDLAVVLWQNADFPDLPLDHVVPPVALWDKPIDAVQHQLRAHVFAAAYRDAADRAGPLLARDVDGLRMAAPGPGADVSLLGHSYGGSIVGSAEAHGLVVDRVVHIASAGGYVSAVDDYAAGECGTRRFSLTDPDDPIQLAQGSGFESVGQAGHSLHTVESVLPAPLKPLTGPITGGLALISGGPTHLGHGLDPDQIPGVTRLDSGVGADGHTLVSGHGGMFQPGSTAWRNLLAVMHGDPVSVLEPGRWHSDLVPAGVGLPVDSAGVHASYVNPHYVVTHSPYDAVGYQPPVQSSTAPVCRERTSW